MTAESVAVASFSVNLARDPDFADAGLQNITDRRGKVGHRDRILRGDSGRLDFKGEGKFLVERFY